MAAAAYNAGEKMYSERDHEWKHPHSSPERVVYREVMLPDNAPREYADSQTLWNAVDAVEKRKDAQTARRMLIVLPKELTYEQNLALIRDYCQQEFVSKGMICDLYYHDEGGGNPHVHLLLTLRAMDEHGEWLDKTRTEYVLDEHGHRVKGKNGKWKRRNVNTVDWNDHKYAEIWRHDWEVMQNAALEAAGRPERIDMRSLERQGILYASKRLKFIGGNMRRIGIFLRSVALPVCVALLLAILFRPIYLSEGQPNYLLAWICIGFPFGIRRMFLWLVPHRFDLAGTVGVVVLNVIVGGIIGGFAFWPIPNDVPISQSAPYSCPAIKFIETFPINRTEVLF